MSNFVNDNKIDNYTFNLHNDHSVEKGILNFGKEINADAIAISTHGKRGVFYLFENSVSSGLANHAIRPVMTFKI